MSIPPRLSVTTLTIRSIPSAVLISAWTKPSCEVPVCTDRPVVITWPPPAVSRSTMAAPIPRVPPVTKMRLPWNSFSSAAFLDLFGSPIDLRDDFQRLDLLAIQFEEEAKIHRAPRKIAGQTTRHNCFLVFLI